MGVNGITDQVNTYNDDAYTKSAGKAASDSAKSGSAEAAKTGSTEAAVYESSSKTGKTESGKIYSDKTDRSAIVSQLKSDAEQRAAQLQSLVSKMLSKQGQTVNSLEEAVLAIKNGKLNVDPATIAQAKKDTAEDGYWGVKQTSERLVSFAKALAGNDPAMADKMIAAFQKGYKQAAHVLGGASSMPGLCKQTYDETMKQLTEWKNGLSASNSEIKSEA